MENILVYATPFKIEEKKWGYKWIGFYNGKRFEMLETDTTEFMHSETENKNIYIFSKANEDMLPHELSRMRFQVPLSIHYFLYGKEREITIEIVMELIEKGFNISLIKMEKYNPYGNGNTNPFLCRYINKANGNIIVEIQTDKTILWKGECL